MADIQHVDIPHVDCHEPRWFGIAVAADAGKVITPSAVDGVSELRKLTFGELTLGDVKASFLRLVDDTDVTKKAVFLASGITTATTRTFTFPDLSGTLVLTAGAQTLTDKTITGAIAVNLKSGAATLTLPTTTGTLATLANAETFTNKRITRRVSSVAYSATLNVNSDSFDELRCNSITANVAIGAPTGTPTEGQRLTVKLTQDGTGSWTITYNAAFVTDGASVTTASTTETREFEWDATRAKWIQLAFTTGI